jgi:hypothetical protein
MSSAKASRRRWIIAACMALVGAAVGYTFGRWIDSPEGSAAFPEWADAGALFLAIALLAQGVIVMLLSFSRRLSGEMFSGEDGRSASPGQVSFYRLQAGVLVLAGVMLALPVVMPLLAGAPLSIAAATGTMAAIGLSFVLQTALNLMVWRRADEFVRRLISETSSLCFWILQAALFLWAAGERLGLLSPISTWDCTVVLMGVYFIASAFISTRNGVGT